MIEGFFALVGIIGWTIWHRRSGARKALKDRQLEELRKKDGVNREE
jgi:hypothetical protein